MGDAVGLGPVRDALQRAPPPRMSAAALHAPHAPLPGQASAASAVPQPASFIHTRCPDCRTGQPPGKYKVVAPGIPMLPAPCLYAQHLRTLAVCEEVELSGVRRRSTCQYYNDDLCYAEVIVRSPAAPPRRRWVPVHRCRQAATTTAVVPSAQAKCYGTIGKRHALVLPPGSLHAACPRGCACHAPKACPSPAPLRHRPGALLPQAGGASDPRAATAP